MARLPVVALHVVVEDLLELRHNRVAAQRRRQLAVDVDRSDRVLEGAGQADAEIGVLGFAGAVHHAAHHGELQLLHAGILLAPLGHLRAQVALNLLGELLEIRACRAAAAGATRHLRHEAADGERLQNLLGGQDFFGAVAVGLGRQAHANRVADAREQQRRESGGRGDQALRAHSGFGQAEVQRIVAARGELGVDVEQIADADTLADRMIIVVAEAVALGGGGGLERAGDHGLDHHVARGQRLGAACCSRPSCASAATDRASPS